MDDLPPCRRCARPVRVNYDVFEGMHFVCFHYEFEHRDVDPDDDCGLSCCPSATGVRHVERLTVVVNELVADWSDGPPANWDNHELPVFLEAFAGWLGDSEGYYASRGRPVPWDAWEVVATALRAATVYE